MAVWQRPPGASPVPLPAPRVRLRPFCAADLDRLARWREEPEARAYQPLRRLTRAELRAELEEASSGPIGDRTRSRFQWIVERLEDQAAIGWVTLTVKSREHGIAEIGYTLSAPYHRRGYGTEAVQLLVARAFAEPDLYRLEAVCAVENEASWRLLERVGFRREGRLREYYVIEGRRVDHYLYACLKPEWAPPRGRGAGPGLAAA
ncbi:MAG TPA: GNAT family protein [Thermodesulfobacteriota bacterium]|nr:GNAT family protein [Thermodesulfobacteriota bacterium]